MRKILSLAGILFLLSTQLIQAQEDVFRHLDPIEKKYSGLKDYVVHVNVHFDIEALKAPDMQAQIYFKAPDKMKVESKKVFFLPKEGGYFNPFVFRKKDFEVKLLERLMLDGSNVVRLKLTPIGTGGSNKVFVLTVDTDRNLIKEIKILPSEGREIKSAIEYGVFNGFELPIHIDLQLDIPTDEPSGMKEFTQFGQRAKRITGKVEISYSNYKVNLGLSDEVFKERDSHQSKSSP